MLALEVGGGAGGKVCCAAVRVVVGVYVCDLCVGAARGEGGLRDEKCEFELARDMWIYATPAKRSIGIVLPCAGAA